MGIALFAASNGVHEVLAQDSSRLSSATTAALAHLEAEEVLPAHWEASPFDIVEGQGFHERADRPIIHLNSQEVEVRRLFDCGAQRCRVAYEQSVPVMVRMIESDGEGVTLLVEWPTQVREVASEQRFGINHVTVRVETRNGEPGQVRVLGREVSNRRAPSPRGLSLRTRDPARWAPSPPHTPFFSAPQMCL
jgi:hypothetical protein